MRIALIFMLLFSLVLSLGCETTPKQVEAVQHEAVDNLHSNYKAINGRTLKLYTSQATQDAEMIKDLLTQQGDPPEEVNAVFSEKIAQIDENVKQTEKDLEQAEKDYKLYTDLRRAGQ